MTYDEFIHHFKVGDKFSISGGVPWEIIAIIEAEKLVISKRPMRKNSRFQDYDIPTNEYVVIYVSQIRQIWKVD